jgi:hypothetical protein
MATKTYDVNGQPITIPQHLQKGFEATNPKATEWPKDRPQNAEQVREQKEKK